MLLTAVVFGCLATSAERADIDSEEIIKMGIKVNIRSKYEQSKVANCSVEELEPVAGLLTDVLEGEKEHLHPNSITQVEFSDFKFDPALSVHKFQMTNANVQYEANQLVESGSRT